MIMRCVLAFILLVAAGLLHPLMACSCRESGPPCAAWGNADGVFLGRVVAISSSEVQVDTRFEIQERILHVRFLVESAFRGIAVGTIEITTSADSGGGCGYPFELNGRYVVYANRESDNSLGTSMCSRTRRVENAAEDLSFFNSLVTAPPGARVYGQLGFREDVPLLAKSRSGPLAGARVILEGPGGPRETVSDEQGRYQIAGLPPGDYEVKPRMATESQVQFYPPSIELKLVERGCGEANAFGQLRGRISGRLSDADGRPVPNQRVEIMPEGLTPLDGISVQLPFAATSVDGLYAFETLPSGRYFVGVSLRSPSHSFLPDRLVYPKTYFPSAAERSEAQVIELPAGGDQREVNIVLPKPLMNREIRGTVVWSDGKPAKSASVNLMYPEYGSAYGDFRMTNANGEFSFAANEGLPYLIVASSDKDSDGKPFRGRLISSITPVQSGENVVTLPRPATLKGRIVDDHDRPLANVALELIPEEVRTWEAISRSRYQRLLSSDAEGRFEISGLAPRRYVLALHASSPPSPSSQRPEYATSFYPGTGNRNLAAVIEVQEGEKRELTNFVLPDPLPLEAVEGVVIWMDDKAVQSGYIAIEDVEFPGYTYGSFGEITADGHFAIQLYKGRRYRILAVTHKDQEGRESLWPFETRSEEILVDAQSRRLQLRMSATP